MCLESSDTEGRVTSLSPDNITDKFRRVLKKAGLHHFRFHNLRHYSASIQHALGVHDVYIMKRDGWETNGVLKKVYRHAMSDHQNEISRKQITTSQHYTTRNATQIEKPT